MQIGRLCRTDACQIRIRQTKFSTVGKRRIFKIQFRLVKCTILKLGVSLCCCDSVDPKPCHSTQVSNRDRFTISLGTLTQPIEMKVLRSVQLADLGHAANTIYRCVYTTVAGGHLQYSPRVTASQIPVSVLERSTLHIVV